MHAHRGFGQGFGGMLEEAFDAPEKRPQSPQPPRLESMSGFQRQLEASKYGGEQDTVQSTIMSQKEKAVNRNFGGGFRGMVDSAFSEGEERGLATGKEEVDAAFLRAKVREMGTRIVNQISKIRMLHKDDPYILSKPAKSEIFSKIFKPRIHRPKKEIADGETFQTMQNYEIVNIRRVGNDLITSYPDKPSEAKVKTLEPLEDGETQLIQRGFCEKAKLTRKGNKLIASFG